MTNQRTEKCQKLGWQETTAPLIELLSQLKEVWPFKALWPLFFFTYFYLFLQPQS